VNDFGFSGQRLKKKNFALQCSDSYLRPTLAGFQAKIVGLHEMELSGLGGVRRAHAEHFDQQRYDEPAAVNDPMTWLH